MEMVLAKKGLRHNVLLTISITFILLLLFVYFFILHIRAYNRNVVGVSLKNSLEELEQVRKADIEVSYFWLDNHLDFNVKLELLSGDTILLENVHKDMVFCKSFASLKKINDLSFVYCRIPISSSPGIPLDLLQIYMSDDFSTVPLFLNKYSEIKDKVMNLPSMKVFYNDSGKFVFDNIDSMGQDFEGHNFKLFKIVNIY